MNFQMKDHDSSGRFGVQKSGDLSVVLTTICLLSWSVPSSAQINQGVAQSVRQLLDGVWIERQTTFKDLGLQNGMVLAGEDVRKEIYFPVPQSVKLSSVRITLDGSFIRGDGGRSTLLLSKDEVPLAVQAPAANEGPLAFRMDLPDVQEVSGFAKLSFHWASQVVTPMCSDVKADANVARLNPDSRLSYRFNSSQIGNVSTAWSALPREVPIFISGRRLDLKAFEAAFRLGLNIERSGRSFHARVFPQIGDVIDRSNLEVPHSLKAIPAYAALTGAGAYKLKELAEIGAILTLPSRQSQMGVGIVDAAFQRHLSEALAALGQQFETQGETAIQAFAALKARVGGGAAVMKAGEMRLSLLYGQPVILISSESSAPSIALLTEPWRRLAASSNLTVHQSSGTTSSETVLPLRALGGAGGGFDVKERGEWLTSFDLASATIGKRMPTEFVIDVSAAPNPSSSKPVASVYFNDVLVGAKRLNADGKPERILGDIPRHALATSNVLKVVFQRQPSGDPCRERPQALPVAVLASSHLLLGKRSIGRSFAGVGASFSDGVQVAVPDQYLGEAEKSLPALARLAAAIGVNGKNLSLSTNDKGFRPAGPFFAVELGGEKTAVTRGKSQLIVAHQAEKLLEIQNVDALGLMEILSLNGKTGIGYRSTGPEILQLARGVRLSRGDMAVLDKSGPLIETNVQSLSSDPDEGGENSSWLFHLSSWPVWLSFLVLILIFVGRAIHLRLVRTR